MLRNSMNNDKLPRHLDGQWEHENLLPPPPHTTISLVPDSEGHKPMRNENNSCDVAQQHE